VPALSSIFLLLSAFSSQALTSQTTRNVIHGSAPYLTFDGGHTHAANVDELLAITLPSGTRITPSTNTSSAINPIQLQYPNKSFTDIGMYMPLNASSVALSTLIGPPHNYWRDDDGDGLDSGGVTATGSLTLSIVDKYDNAVSRRDTLDICKAPYRITLRSTGGTLSTGYGVPKSRNFSASTATYYINPNVSQAVCFVKPILRFGSNNEPNLSGFNFAGPSNIWNPDKGFLIQSTDPAHYDRNFPTTGAHNLYFDLTIEGVNANELSWPPVTHSGITAKMTPDSSGTSVRVKLGGPVATSKQWHSSSPGNIPRPSLPATFELVGRDSNGRAVIKYGFSLKQWFVNRGTDRRYSSPDALSWCNSIGYSIPRVRDLTNAQCTGAGSGYWCQGSVGATPTSSGNHYMRYIDAGFFSEWGNMIHYIAGANFSPLNYWTSDATDSNQFLVGASTGGVGVAGPGNAPYVVCASVLRP
jgi:hypothetical protein